MRVGWKGKLCDSSGLSGPSRTIFDDPKIEAKIWPRAMGSNGYTRKRDAIKFVILRARTLTVDDNLSRLGRASLGDRIRFSFVRIGDTNIFLKCHDEVVAQRSEMNL